MAAKLAFGAEGWSLESKPRSQLLRPTVINGLIACLRLMIKNDNDITDAVFKAGFKDLKLVDFTTYKSSAWQELGKEIYGTCFDK